MEEDPGNQVTHKRDISSLMCLFYGPRLEMAVLFLPDCCLHFPEAFY